MKSLIKMINFATNGVNSLTLWVLSRRINGLELANAKYYKHLERFKYMIKYNKQTLKKLHKQKLNLELRK